MITWAAINYRGFYDVPRNFIVNHRGRQLLFSCPFDDELDEYPATYRVYVLPTLTEADLEGDWEQLPQKATQALGEISIDEVPFDPTRRRAVDTTVLDNLMNTVHPKKA